MGCTMAVLGAAKKSGSAWIALVSWSITPLLAAATGIWAGRPIACQAHGQQPAAPLAQLLTPHCPTLCPPYAAAWVAAQYKMAAHKLQRQASGAEDAAPAQLGASQALTAAIARCRGYPFRGCPRCARCLCCAVPLVCPSCCPDMRRLRSLDICLQAEPGRAAGPGAALGLAGWQAVDVCRNWEAHERQQ